MSVPPYSHVVKWSKRRPRVAALLGLAAIVIASTVLRIAINSGAPGPWIFVDELIYSELGRSAFGTQGLRGVPVSGYGAGYPLMIGPAYAFFDSLVTAFGVVKALNALAMSLVAIPVYVTARTVVGRRWSLVAAVLAVLVPAMAYSSVVMTENAFYPAFALATMLIVRALRKPTVMSQLLAFGGVVVCIEVRSQGAVLAVAYVASVVAVVIIDAAGDSASLPRAAVAAVRQYWLTFAIVVVGGLGTVFWLARSERSLSSLLGAYAVTAEATDRYHAKPIAAWTLLHLSELDLWLGVAPAVALLALIGAACARGASRDLRIFAVAATTITGAMALVVASFVVFANVGRIEERNLFYVGILPLIALCWWVANGLPRNGRWFVMALVVCAGLPLAIPFPALINQSAASDTFGLHLPWAMSENLGDPNLTVYAVAVGAFAVAAFLLFLPARRAPFVILLVVGYFAAASIAINIKTDSAARGSVAQGIGGTRDWVDRAVGTGGDVAIVYPGSLEPLKVWQNEFFNRSIRNVYTIGVPLPGGLPDVVVNAGDGGRVVDRAGNPIAARYVLEHDSATVVGTVVAEDAAAHMLLVRAEPPLRFSDTVTGIFDDGWTGPQVAYTRFACGGGSVSTTVRLDGQLHADAATVTPYSGDHALAPVSVPPGRQSVRIVVPVSGADGVCQVRFDITPALVPAQNPALGSSDPRALGVLMTRPEFQPD